MNFPDTQTLIQAGGVVIAIYAIYLLYKISSNHLEHSTAALQELTDVIRDLKSWLQSNK